MQSISESFRLRLEPKALTGLVIKTLVFVLFIGVLWEFFEFFTNNHIGRDLFNMLDTISDIFFDLAGGTLAVFYFLKRIMRVELNKVE